MSEKERKRWRVETEVLTRGFDPSLSVGSARPAVFRSSTYVFSSPEAAERSFAIALGKIRPMKGEDVELIYSRLSHPNAEILEDHMVPLETGAKGAAVFNTGMAAISTLILTVCRPGDALIHTVPLYGGTHHLLHELMEPYGIRPVAVPAGNREALAKAIDETEKLAMVFVETPANPTLRMTNLVAAAEAAALRDPRPIVAVDNTFLGPVYQHPLALGADVCAYSATKYLAGFSDMLGGVLTATDPELLERLRGTRALLGNILQPDESWLLDSRLATVALRMNRQSKNAQRIVTGLAGHEGLTRIYYPDQFVDEEQIETFRAQCDFPGGIFSIELVGGKQAAFEFLRRLRIARNAVSLGGVESLACHPATTTHSEMSDAELGASGVTPGLVRISVGIEDWRDLLADFRSALDAIR